MSRLTFQLLRRDSTGSDSFSVGSTSGLLIANEVIDRDVICPREVTCVVMLQITVEPGEYFQLIQVRTRKTILTNWSVSGVGVGDVCYGFHIELEHVY